MIERIIREASRMMLQDPGEVHGKTGLANFVTDRDVEIQKYLIRELSSLYPGCHFYGEENTGGNDRELDGICFYIDPIDGTTNYIFGYHHSCVSVGMARDGEMVSGYVYNPFTDQFYEAEKGKGAKLNGRPMVTPERSLEEGIVAFGCARYNEGDTDALFDITKELYLRSLSVRNGGSAALDLVRVASGANVGYIELKLQPYDYAAASIIISEAGGVISQVNGDPITLDGPCSVLAGTQKAAGQIREIALSRMEQYKPMPDQKKGGRT